MKLEKLTDVVNNPEHPLMKEVRANFNSAPGDTITCKNCGQSYKRGVWDFYNLCDPCFSEYNRKKMEERLQWLKNQTK